LSKRAVSYARVSNLRAGERGASLVSQEQRFVRFLEAHPEIERVRSYAESASGGSIEGRATFSRMLNELPNLNVDYVLVDALDRYTRNLGQGLTTLEQLRQLGVRLWELESDEDRPYDLTTDSDWRTLVARWTDAEAERRRGIQRQKKAYRARRDIGATTTNRPAWGLKLDGPTGNRRIVVDPEQYETVRQIEDAFLEGKSSRKLLELCRDLAPVKGWKSRNAIMDGLRNTDDKSGFVSSGARTPERQARLRAEAETRYASDRKTIKFSHEFSGLLACGECVAAGFAPEKALLIGRYVIANEPKPLQLFCKGERQGRVIHPTTLYFSLERILERWLVYFDKLRDPELAAKVLDLWKRLPQEDRQADARRALERELSHADAEEGTLDMRADLAMTLAAAGTPGAMDEAKRLLERLSTDRAALLARRASLRQRLVDLPPIPDRSITADALSDLQAQAQYWDYVFEFDGEGVPVDNRWRPYMQRFIQAFGHPIVTRRHRAEQKWRGAKGLKVRWPALDELFDRSTKLCGQLSR
jgi:DNA invertase Pin-like site-specific DNA recombinase